MALRVLLVDDSLEFIESAARFLAGFPQIDIVGLALSGQDALKLIGLARPDLVLMDLAMPGMNGLEVTARIRTCSDAPRVILLTLHDLAEYRAAAKVAGADGFVSKAELGRQLLPVIDSLFAETLPRDHNDSSDPARESRLKQDRMNR